MLYLFPCPSRCRVHRLTVFLLALLLISGLAEWNVALAGTAKAYQISAIKASRSDTGLDLRIQGTQQPAYTVYELFNPPRIVVDIAEAELPKDRILLPENTGINLQTKTVDGSGVALLRLEFTLPSPRSFTTRSEGNDIILSIDEKNARPQTTASNGSGMATIVEDIQVETTGDLTRVVLKANGKLRGYRSGVLDKTGSSPPRLYLDLDNVRGDTLLKEQEIGTALARVRVARRGSGLRVVLDASGSSLFPFEIKERDNGLEIVIREETGSDQISSLIGQKQLIEQELPQVDPLNVASLSRTAKKKAAQTMQDNFSFAGYKKERITVDFYKIDLHNVFRLLREVSGKNIVVDESVSGSLTLALNDVPWDFALDIILQLKNLQKVERFNTIVILPKEKAFAWPERAEDNLSFEADEKLTAQEAIVIQQRENIPERIIEARQIIARARQAETAENYETAVQSYTEALKKWPENSRLANKIASLFLVQLRQNAKAVFYAKKALDADPTYTSAALNAAIALANMKMYSEALQYFDQSVSVPRPSAEALLSYAVFSEEQQEYAAALKLLRKHDRLYGGTLNSMVAEARVLDKMGKREAATEKYRAILLSGYRVPPDLKKYIAARVALDRPM
ncbi:AMIN domain-containing protein [Desulfolithobacter sp.]